MADTREHTDGNQRAAHAKHGHTLPPRAAAASGASSPPRPPAPPGCHACGARAPYGLFGAFYCSAHLPVEFWDVKRRAEGAACLPAAAQGAPRKADIPKRASPPPSSGEKQGSLL